ncbi:MAG: hypothetical protein HY062_07875 [Bacteroidetes bacterium]|nr:hypothetical protein [Bacteroidota bacterium]
MNSELNNLEWFKTGFETYNPTPSILSKIGSSLNNYTIEVIMDEDCKDVQFLIPKLFKTLYLCKVNSLKIYHIDKNILPVNINEGSNKIEKVPTIFFIKNGIEQFSIVEKIIYGSTIENEIDVLLSKKKINN